MSVVVVDVGCLECGYESNLVGVYPDEAAARAANPDMHMRAEFVDGDYDGDDYYERPSWHGQAVTVGFPLPEQTEEAPQPVRRGSDQPGGS